MLHWFESVRILFEVEVTILSVPNSKPNLLAVCEISLLNRTEVKMLGRGGLAPIDFLMNWYSIVAYSEKTTEHSAWG